MRNTSPPVGLEASFFVDGEQLATMRDTAGRPPYSYELTTPGGAVFARVSNPGGRVHTLEVLDRSDPRLVRLAVGFACGMADRVWVMAPAGGGYRAAAGRARVSVSALTNASSCLVDQHSNTPSQYGS